MKKRQWEGSFTIEMTFVFPIIFFMVLALIFLTFQLYDKAKITSILHNVEKKGEFIVRLPSNIETGTVDYSRLNEIGLFYFLEGNQEEIERIIKDYLEVELDKQLIVTSIDHIEVIATPRNIKISLYVQCNVPISGIKSYFDNVILSPIITTEYPVNNSAEFVRQFDTLLKLGEKIKGINQLLEKIGSIIEKVK